MVSATRRELAQIGVSDTPGVAVADSGYWQSSSGPLLGDQTSGPLLGTRPSGPISRGRATPTGTPWLGPAEVVCYAPGGLDQTVGRSGLNGRFEQAVDIVLERGAVISLRQVIWCYRARLDEHERGCDHLVSTKSREAHGRVAGGHGHGSVDDEHRASGRCGSDAVRLPSSVLAAVIADLPLVGQLGHREQLVFDAAEIACLISW